MAEANQAARGAVTAVVEHRDHGGSTQMKPWKQRFRRGRSGLRRRQVAQPGWLSAGTARQRGMETRAAWRRCRLSSTSAGAARRRRAAAKAESSSSSTGVSHMAAREAERGRSSTRPRQQRVAAVATHRRPEDLTIPESLVSCDDDASRWALKASVLALRSPCPHVRSIQFCET